MHPLMLEIYRVFFKRNNAKGRSKIIIEEGSGDATLSQIFFILFSPRLFN
jgi:hypothetical protein